MARLGKKLLKFPIAGITITAATFLAGMVFWGGFNWSLELTNTEDFCISCHVMEEYVYKEYRTTVHHANRTGVRATCPDCHVPREWVHKVTRKVGAVNELFHWIAGSIDTPARFEAKRHQLARHVWASMKQTDSRECRNCHGMEAMAQQSQEPQAGIVHGLATEWSMTCIDCHKGIAHSLPREFDKYALMDDLHERMEREDIDCKLCHEDIASAPSGDGW